MTKQIICLKYAERKPKDYPGEWWHREQGKARGFANGDFVCDQCNATIPKGSDCVAQSFGLYRYPYHPWEHEYLGESPGAVDGTVRVFDRDGNLEQEIPPSSRK